MNRWTLRATGYGALAAALSIAGLAFAGQAGQGKKPEKGPEPTSQGPGQMGQSPGQMGPGPHHAQRTQRVFEYFDLDQSGDITRAEVQSVALRHFSRIDADDDNLVSKPELMESARKSRAGAGESLDAKAERGLAMVFLLGDADDDGTISQVEMQTKINQIFAVIDRNQDGVLERDEYRLSSETELGNGAPPAETPPTETPPSSTQPQTPPPPQPQTTPEPTPPEPAPPPPPQGTPGAPPPQIPPGQPEAPPPGSL